MNSAGEMEKAVRQRAAERCEYCRMHQSLQGATFHVEHIIPRSRGGVSDLDNLAWACPSCNLHKSNRVEVPAPDGGELVPLFHPRRDHWHDHFRWNGYRITGLTTIGNYSITRRRLFEIRDAILKKQRKKRAFGK